jgi:hypothetical protein
MEQNQVYQKSLQRAKAELRVSHQQFLQGRAKPLDLDAMMARVRSKREAPRTIKHPATQSLNDRPEELTE